MQNNNSSVQASEDMCVFCFDVLISELEKKKKPIYPEHLPKVKVPIFVTWHKDGDELRGCIGTFSSESLEQNLAQYTLISAFQDSRFSPISKHELTRLNVSVSLLVNFDKSALHPLDWQIGKHGIIITFNLNGKNYQGTFLPEVAAEQKWDQLTTIKQLLKKTGYRGSYESVEEKINIERYQSSKYQLTFDQYLKIKQIAQYN